MDGVLPISHPVRAAEIAGRRPFDFALVPDDAARGRIAAALGLRSIGRLRFDGQLAPRGRRDVDLTGQLTARVVQSCVVTLAPVAAEIAVPVERIYVAGLEMPGPGEVEMPEDDRIEPLPDVIDLGAVLVEALALALPDYPRSPGAELGAAVFAPPGAAPLTDEAIRPFAALRALKASPGPDEGGGG
ncbi:MAG: YceD family protein [Gemmobacter sp.]